jgi:hypothetical protein
MDTTQEHHHTERSGHFPMHNESLNPREDAWEYFQSYARQRPEVVALWCLGLGFVLGWKLKPW